MGRRRAVELQVQVQMHSMAVTDIPAEGAAGQMGYTKHLAVPWGSWLAVVVSIAG